MKAILAAAVALLLAIPAAASAATVPVTSLTGAFEATNPSVTLVADGVAFGPYANGASAGGSVYYAGANGLKLSQVTALAYSAIYNTTEDTNVGVPYLRVFLNGDNDDVIFSPNTQVPPIDISENEPHTYHVTSGTVRYDDDCDDGINYHSQTDVGDCSGLVDPLPGVPGDTGANPPDDYGVNGASWATVVGDHGDEVVSGIYITTGFSGGTDLSALLSDLTVNDTTFAFGAPVAGSPGNTGATGPTGVAGTAGTTTTVVVQQAASQVRLVGAQLRIIHVQRRKGEKFLSARATLRGKSLKVRGRAIQVDLRNKPAGNYNVHIVAKYRTKSGKVHIVRSARNLSVTPAT
jgi:hypothetical protein